MTTLREAFMRVYEARWAGTRDEDKVLQRWGRVERLLGRETDVAGVTQDEVDEAWRSLLTEAHVGRATANRHASLLNPVLEAAGSAVRAPRYREGAGRTRVVTADELARLCARMRPENARLARFLWETGLRLGEALSLTWGDLRPGSEGGPERVVVRRSKNDSQRAVPLSAGAAAAVPPEHLEATAPLFDTERVPFQRDFKAARQADPQLANDAEVVPHSLRHSCATRLVEAGVSLFVVQRWLGHRTLAATQRYAHVRDSLLEQAADALSRLPGPAAGRTHEPTEPCEPSLPF